MIRFLIALLALVATTAFALTEIDLDKPGAMEALAREKPAHFKKVQEEISKAQEIRVDPQPILRQADNPTAPTRALPQNAPRLVVPNDDPIVLPANPAKKRLLVTVDGIAYRVTAHLTKHPAHLQNAQ